MNFLRKTLTLTLLLAMCSIGFAQEITVAAAADLQYAFADVAGRFEKDTGHHVNLTFGSSGNFSTQIQNGAPFDLFFSADSNYPKQLEEKGLVEPGSFYSYAVGKIVLYVPNGSKLDLSRGLKGLLDPSIKKISIANPEHAPYGRAAVAALHKEGIYDQVSARFVTAENISQAAQFVASGNADAGIVALSLALAPAMQQTGNYVAIPADDYPAIEQAAVILKSSKQKDVARQFLQFLKTPATVDVMKKYGFESPSH
jgi:molybdate transport system substrate-binding protein